MRVTNAMLVSNFMGRLNNNLSRLDKVQAQLATGKKNPHLSDDPVALIYSQQAKYNLNRLEHYKMSVQSAQEWLMQAEGGVMELNELMKSAYEACVDAATDVKSDSDKSNAAEYIGQLRDQIIHTLNATYGTKYVFGGYDTTGAENTAGEVKPPFEARDVGGDMHVFLNGFDLTAYDPATASPADQAAFDALKGELMSFPVAVGIDMPVTLNGIDLIFYGTDGSGKGKNIFNLLDDLYNAADTGEGADVISGYISELQEAQDHLLGLTAEIGGRTNRLDILSSRYEQDYLNYTQMLSDAEDADEAEIIMNYKMAQTVYQAALSTGASIIQPTLMDFLR